MKKHIQLFISAVVLLLALGCKGTFAPPEIGEEKPKTEPAEQDEKYSPLGQSEDFVVVSRAVDFKPAVDSTSSQDGSQSTGQTDGSESELTGDRVYRIQLYTSKEYGPAIREKNVAVEVFDKPVTMDYEVPYYKIRVGNFATQEEADQYLPAAREAGYKTAWVVRAYVNVNTIEDIYDGYDEEIFKPLDSVELLEYEYDAKGTEFENQEN